MYVARRFVFKKGIKASEGDIESGMFHQIVGLLEAKCREFVTHQSRFGLIFRAASQKLQFPFSGSSTCPIWELRILLCFLA